jgi:hypothetical protein
LVVYLVLVDRLGDNATCWPKVGSIMADTGCAERTVQAALRVLEQTGWIAQVKDSDRRANEYSLHIGGAIERVTKARDAHEVAPDGAADCTPAEAQGIAPMGAADCADGCNPLRLGVQSAAPEPVHEHLQEQEITPKRACVPTHAHEAPSQPAQLSLTPEPQPAPKPQPQSQPKRPSKPQPPKPEPLDPAVWDRFAALAVESGQVGKLPEPGAQSYQKGKTRADVLAALVAEHGAERVLAVWRHTLTSPRKDPTWWRTNREGPSLIGAFLAGEAFQKLADDLEAAQSRVAKPKLVSVLTLDGLHPIDKLVAVIRQFGDEPPAEEVTRAACGTAEHFADVVEAARYVGRWGGGRGTVRAGWYQIYQNPSSAADFRKDWDRAQPMRQAQ